ncbi:uncharacterized protein LOC112638865 [Camponotus floridanus]|uniref:uncharacterized protein LOC112638865 n=1 Tax=Camponotus floridanus TaxID=104421 RepID=UPI000DC6A420|nr:uncharacterized protein LOC112638865 [Camponotus floridanus]
MSKLDKNVIEEDTVSRNSSAGRDDKLDSLFSKVEQDCLSVFRKTENTTSTCMVKQKSKLTKSALEEHNNIALKETPTEVNENIQFLFSKLICASELLCSSKTENATSTWMVKQTSELIKNVTGEDTAFKETPTEIEMEIKEPQQNTEIKLDKFTKRILQHLKLRNVLRTAVHDVMIDNRSISDVAGTRAIIIKILRDLDKSSR